MLEEADQADVRWPLTWAGEEDAGRSKKLKECLLALNSCPKVDGKYNEPGALSQLFLKFGQNAPAASSSAKVKEEVEEEEDAPAVKGEPSDEAEAEVKKEVKEAKDMTVVQLKKTLKKVGLEKETENFLEKGE